MSTDKIDFYVKRFKAGDKNAFNYIYDATYKPAYFKVLYLVKSKAVAEDVLHDAYLKAMQYVDRYKEGTNFIGWLCTIAKNTAINKLKRQSRETSTDFDADAYKFGVAEPEIPFIFELASKTLPEDEYNIIMLCQVAGYKRREVAQMLDMPIGTVTWKTTRR